MTTEAFGSVPHGTPPASNSGASSYGGQSSPDELLEGIKRIRKRKQAALSIPDLTPDCMRKMRSGMVGNSKAPAGVTRKVKQSAKEKIANHIRLTILLSA